MKYGNVLVENLQSSEVTKRLDYVVAQQYNCSAAGLPLSDSVEKEILLYANNYRNQLNIAKGHEDFVFLNRRGKQLTRVMIFTIIKQLATDIGLKKSISPHTFRHSFATHLFENGANLRAIQEMLGHESILTTEIYTHIGQTAQRDAILQCHPRNKY